MVRSRGLIVSGKTIVLIIAVVWLVIAYLIGLSSFSSDARLLGMFVTMLPLMLVAQYLKVRGRRRD